MTTMTTSVEPDTKTAASSCTCGHNYAMYNHNGEIIHQQYHQSSIFDQQQRQLAGTTVSSTLDTSFVQIPLDSRIPPGTTANVLQPVDRDKTDTDYSQITQKKFTSSYNHFGNSNFHYINGIQHLYAAVVADTATTSSKSDPKLISLCQKCVHRIERTLMADTERLLAESLLYEQAIYDDEAYRKNWKQMMYRAIASDHNIDREVISTANSELPVVADDITGNHDTEQNIEDTYLSEIRLLERACQEQRDELLQLRVIQKEQILVYDELEQFSESIATEQNALELEARAFDNDQEQLSRMLAEVQNEIDRLTSSDIRLPALLVQLHIDDERGLRYPLINELRLAYRPKGDVHQQEIQAAWALASYLLLVVATIFEFQSQNWKIVPLSHCAKLLYCPISTNENVNSNQDENRVIVFNLGHSKTNGSKALLTWNALLCQVIEQVIHKTSTAVQNGILDAVEIPQIPFKISPTSIGGVLLTQLNEDDDSGWSRVIHYMTSNLQWLSKCASIYILHQVVLLTPLRGIETNIDKRIGKFCN